MTKCEWIERREVWTADRHSFDGPRLNVDTGEQVRRCRRCGVEQRRNPALLFDEAGQPPRPEQGWYGAD